MPIDEAFRMMYNSGCMLPLLIICFSANEGYLETIPKNLAVAAYVKDQEVSIYILDHG